jgi:hydrogenase maturation protease
VGRLVVCFGNPLRADDGVAWRVAGLLEERLGGHPVQVIACQQLTPELAEPISHVELVVFVDASLEAAPGVVTCEAVSPGAPAAWTFSHGFDPSALLSCAERLYGTCPRALIVTVGGQSFELGEGLSAAAEAAVPTVLSRIEALVTASC